MSTDESNNNALVRASKSLSKYFFSGMYTKRQKRNGFVKINITFENLCKNGKLHNLILLNYYCH